MLVFKLKPDVESAKLTGAAQSKLAGAQAQGSMFSSIGGALGKGIGGLGSSGGTNLVEVVQVASSYQPSSLQNLEN